MSNGKNGFFERIKSNKYFQKLKSIKNIEIIIAVIVCLLAIGIYLALGVSSKQSKSKADVTESTSVSELESIISNIKGVGKTKVLITYQNDKDGSLVTEGGDSSDKTSNYGGSYWASQSNKKDEQLTNSKIVGVIVVSKGASNPEVEVKILKAVQIATGVSIDKIRIFEME